MNTLFDAGWMTVLLEAALKGSLLWMLAGAAAHLCRKQSAAVRHLVWSAAVLSMAALPLATYLTPAWVATRPNAAISGTRSAAIAPEAPKLLPSMVVEAGMTAVRSASASEWLLWAWAAGCGTALLTLMTGLGRLAWTAWRSQALLDSGWMRLSAELSARFGLGTPVALLLHPGRMMPVTWGVLRPRILLPAEALEWPDERRRIVLSHEIAHVRRRDWLVQILAELGRALYWFHPLVWMGCSRLRQESEHACDDAVLTSGIHAPDYAEHLLELARTLKSPDRAWSVALAMARQSYLERRFIAMLDPTRNRHKASRSAAVLTTLAAITILLPLASLRAPAQSIAGKFFGTVYDASGGAIPNATIIASNPEARTKDMTTSDAAGVFQFPALQAGTYTVEVLKPGFARFAGSVKLEPNQSRNENFTLQVGSVSEQVDVTAEGPAKPVDYSRPPSRLRIGGNVQATKLIQKVNPVYPVTAKKAGIEGSVLLEAVISREGTPLSLRVMNSQIDPDLAKAAVEAVSQWRYAPTLLNGNPVEVMTAVTVNFHLLP